MSLLNKINPFTLQFEDHFQEKQYQFFTKEQPVVFLRFLCLIALTVDIVLIIVYGLYGKFETFYISFPLLFVISVIYYLLHKFTIQKKIILEMIICLVISTIFLCHVEAAIPEFLLKTQNYSHQDKPWVMLHTGIGLETVVIIMYVSKIKWIYTGFFNILLNFLVVRHFAFDPDLESRYRIVFFHTFLVTLIIPFFICFLTERSERLNYINIKKSEESIFMFEKLISEIIPNQIMVLKIDQPKIVYANNSALNYFKTGNYDKIYEKLIKIKIEQKKEKESSIETFFDLYQNIIEVFDEKSVNKFKVYEGSVSKKDKKDKNKEKTTYFEIKVGQIYWKEEKAILVLLNETTSFYDMKKFKEINEYKDNLLASVSHDLRSPLNAIMGMLELALEQIKEKATRKFLLIAQKSSKVLLYLVNDILDYCQFNNDKLRLNMEKIRINSLISDVVSIIKFQAKKKSLKFIIEASAEIKNNFLFCDMMRFQQVLLNLLGNAVKFTFQGFIKLQIFSDENYAKFMISDSGIGIDQAFMPNLFTFFYKNIDVNEKYNKRGIGIGLALSQNLIKLMNSPGITVRSKLKEGSEFSFLMPFANDDEIQTIGENKNDVSSLPTDLIFNQEKKEIEPLLRNNINFLMIEEKLKNGDNTQNKSNPGSKRDKRKPKALLIDDEKVISPIHAKYIESFDISIEIIMKNEDALKKICAKKDAYNFVFLYCNKSIMNTFEMAQKIKESVDQKKINELPIVIVYSEISNEDVLEFAKIGINFFMEKNTTKESMRETIMNIINRN